MQDERDLQGARNANPFELVAFDGDKDLGPVSDLRFDPDRDTIWANTEQMSKLFGKSPKTINEHLRTIFREGELDETSVVRKFRITAEDGKSYSVLHYNLDVVISVGYRVSSRQATKFRQWATGVLRQYLLQGYALNERRLDDDPSALRSLAAEVRALRTKEKNIYKAVRDLFPMCAVDYDQKAPECRSFFAKLQDKLLYATTGQTACEVILGRADGHKDFMGLTSTTSGRPTKSDATVGKNYLESEELYELQLICEQFLLFAETKAVRGQELTMKELDEKFDELLRLQGFPVFEQYKSFLKRSAVDHASRELDVYRHRMRLERKNLDGSPRA